MIKLFQNPQDPDLSKTTQTIKKWVEDKLNLHPEAVVSVIQVNCSEPNCPDLETLIHILEENKPTKTFRIRKPMVFIRKWDVEIFV